MDDLPRRDDDGLFTIMLRPCTARVLLHLLDPEVPYAWVLDHAPHRSLEWWRCRLPLVRSGVASEFEVRGLRFDLLLPTSEFLTRLDDFDGVSVLQMRRRVPNTLTMEGHDVRHRTRLLVQNGLVAHFHLPHAMECAWFATVERPAIEKALAIEAVRALAY